MKHLTDALFYVGCVATGVFGMCCVIFTAQQCVTLMFSLGWLHWRQ